VTFSGHG